MSARTCMPAVLLAGALCAGCGSGHYWHQVRLKLDADADAEQSSAVEVGIEGSSYMNSQKANALPMHAPDTNGVVSIAYRALQGTWVWQKRPASLSFGVFIPSVSTNGYFQLFIDEASKLPTRSMTPKTVLVRANYLEFTTQFKGSRPIHTLRATVIPLSTDGYRVEMDLPIETLGHAVRSEFVPRQSRAKRSR